MSTGLGTGVSTAGWLRWRPPAGTHAGTQRVPGGENAKRFDRVLLTQTAIPSVRAQERLLDEPAAANPVVTRALADGPKPGCVDLRQGEVVRVAFGDTEAHLRLTPGAGWTIEADALTPQDRASFTSMIATLTGARL